MKKKMAKTLAVLMCMMTAVAFMPTFAFAAGDSVKVTVTVSNMGEIATDNSGNPVAAKEITVTDKDGDGGITLNDAFMVTHEKFNSADGYSLSYGYCNKFWGVPTGNLLGFVNGVAGGSTWEETLIEDGDYIVASINADNMGNDFYTAFDKTAADVKEGESVELTLNGHNGMSGGEDEPVTGMQVKQSNGTALGTTDAKGKISLSFDKAGTYVVTAAGRVNAAITDSYLFEASKKDKNGKTIYATKEWGTENEAIVYYTENPGEAPYDSSLMYSYSTISVDEFDPDTFDDGYLLYSNEYKGSVPTIAPACVVTVNHGQLVHKKEEAGNLKNGCEYDECTVCKSKLNQKTIAGWSTNYVKSFKVKKGKKSFTAKWKKQSKKNRKKFNGYQLRYSNSSNMAGAKYVNVGKNSKSKKIKKLAKKTNYYVQVRSYTDSNGTRYYAGWSSVKSVKTK